MYLTKLELPLASRQTADALANAQAMHRLVTSLFAASRETAKILYRVRVLNGVVQIYLYSSVPHQALPAGVQLVGQRDLTDWVSAMQEGQVWKFDLVAMPSKKVYQPQRHANSRRRVLRSAQERMTWLQRKADQNGFCLLQAEELEQSHSRGMHSKDKGGWMYWDAYHYQGKLQVTDAELFRRAITEGIGPGKAYGLGMILLQRL